MEDLGKRVDVQNLLSLGDDLIGVLGNSKDADNLIQSVEGAEALRSSCQEDSYEIHRLIEDYEKKIKACKEKLDKAKNETAVDGELEQLQRELEEKVQIERLLQQELRVVSDELDALELKRISFEERKEIVKKREKDVLKAQNLLSMCASVTSIIPDLDDETRISGFIFNRNKKNAEKFELDLTLSPMEICDKLWKMAEP